MAGHNNTTRKKILHKQTFQNSNQVVELTVKTIPKTHLAPLSMNHQRPFVRNCAARNELERISNEKNNNVNKERLKKRKLYASGEDGKVANGRVTVEVSQGRGHKKGHGFVPPDSTWADVLHNISTSSRIGEERSQRERDVWRDVRTSVSPCEIPRSERENVPERPRTMGLSCSTLPNVQKDKHTQNEDQNAYTKSEQIKNQGNNRLLSDDVNASPFGESALQLLRQLKERLQSKGPSEGSDMMGILEAFINRPDTMGDVGLGSAPDTIPMSPVHHSVFPTPAYDKSEECRILYHSQQHAMQPQGIRHPDLQSVPSQVTRPAQKPEILVTPEKCQHSTAPEHSHSDEILSQEESSVSLSYKTNHQYAHQRVEHHSDHSPDPVAQSENDQMKKQLDEKDKKIEMLSKKLDKHQEEIEGYKKSIKELQLLSARLITQYEQFPAQCQRREEEEKEKSISNENNGHDRENGFGAETKVRDSPKTKELERELKAALLQTQTENETLRREVRSQRDVMVNLEIQLQKAHQALDSERRSRSELSTSRLSGSSHIQNLNAHRMQPPSVEKSSQTESEVDSAYEERTASQVTSHVNSPHLENPSGQQYSKQRTSGLSLSPQARESRFPKMKNADDEAVSTHGVQPSINRNYDIVGSNTNTNEMAYPPSQILEQSTVQSQVFSRLAPKSVTSSNSSLCSVPQVRHKNEGLANIGDDQALSDVSSIYKTTYKESDVADVPVNYLDDPAFSSVSVISEPTRGNSLTEHEASYLKERSEDESTFKQLKGNRNFSTTRDTIEVLK